MVRSSFAKIILLCIVLAGAVYLATNGRITAPVDLETLALVAEPMKVATGNEINVKVRTLRPKHVVVEVINQSSEYVYLPYLPGSDGNRAEYAIRRIEEWDESEGKFVSMGDGHYSPGLNPLTPGDSYTYDLDVVESGKYRVAMPVLLDERLRDRIINLHALSNDQYSTELNAIGKELDLARGMFTTPTFSF